MGKNYKEIFKKHWKNVGNISHKLKKKSDGNFVKFSRQFLEEHTKNCPNGALKLYPALYVEI